MAAHYLVKTQYFPMCDGCLRDHCYKDCPMQPYKKTNISVNYIDPDKDCPAMVMTRAQAKANQIPSNDDLISEPSV